MGWQDSHLHRFRTGSDHRSPHLITQYDLDEDDDGVLEDDVRLDQTVAAEGDRLWYEYDFGDGWDHVLRVEQVLDERPTTARCTAGRMACPPEDCGGTHCYEELAAWVRDGYPDTLVPDVFEGPAHARDWLPRDWHPDHFDVAECDAAISAALAEPVAVTGALAELLDQLERRGIRLLRQVLSRPLAHGPVEVSDAEAARLTEPYRVLLDSIGHGVTLTAADYLPPATVETIADGSGITGWWIGKANREDMTPPVAAVRDTARALGLVTVRKGRLLLPAAGVRGRRDPQRLWQHIIGRLPVSTTELDRHPAVILAGELSGCPVCEGSSRAGSRQRGESQQRDLAVGLLRVGAEIRCPRDDLPPHLAALVTG